MALAEKLHHTSRGQRFARAGEEGREAHDALRRQRPPPPQPELFQLYEEEPGGSRPACLAEQRGPQEKVQQCTVEQLADVVPMVQVLDAPGLLGEVGVVDLLRELDAPALDELVIAVPKISLDRIPQRCPHRRPRRAEQLVEVPTIISYSSLQQRNVEQTIDIPVPHGRVGGRGLQGFLPGQGSAASSSHVGSAEEAGHGVFRTFLRWKKSAGLVRTGCRLFSMESGGSCRVHGGRLRRGCGGVGGGGGGGGGC